MKARAPSIRRPVQLPFAVPQSKFSCYARQILDVCSGHGPRPAVGHFASNFSALQRTFCSTASLHRISLAERIKQFLPAEAIESTDPTAEDVLVEIPIKSTLAAYESEISRAVSLVNKLQFEKAGDYLMENLPLQVVLSSLIDRIVPAIQNSTLGSLGVTEFAYILFLRGNSALVSQAFGELREVTADSGSNPFGLIQVLETYKESGLNAVQLDVLMQSMANNGTMGTNGLHFPQILSSSSVSPWLKVRLVLLLNPQEFRRWLSKYSTCLPPQAVSLIALAASPPQYETLADWIVADEANFGAALSVLPVTSTPVQFRQLSRPLLRRAARTEIPGEVARSLLHTALRLRQSYDIANICKRCAHAFTYPEHLTLMAKALLAAAFAQRKPEDLKSESNPVVFNSSRELHSFLVNRVLAPVAHDRVACNAVIGLAVSRLLHIHSRQIPGKVLWQLLLSLPGPLGGTANTALAKAIVRRPYIEQARYMALPTVTAHGVRELLKWHITKIMEHRRLNAVQPELPQAKEDIQLLVAGLMLASEKSQVPMSNEANEANRANETNDAHGADSKASETFSESSPVSSFFSDLFENTQRVDFEAPPRAAAVATAMDSVTQDLNNLKLSTSIAFYVVAELVRQKSYTVAKQLFRAIGPYRLPPATVHTLLLNLAQDQPEDSYKFVLWLTNVDATVLRPHTVNKMLSILTSSPTLTESQLVNRFQNLRQLLRTQLRTPIDQGPAMDLVDALIRSSVSRRGGSLQRLRWALGVAKHAGVPDAKFKQWSDELDRMHQSKEGYWSSPA